MQAWLEKAYAKVAICLIGEAALQQLLNLDPVIDSLIYELDLPNKIQGIDISSARLKPSSSSLFEGDFNA